MLKKEFIINQIREIFRPSTLFLIKDNDVFARRLGSEWTPLEWSRSWPWSVVDMAGLVVEMVRIVHLSGRLHHLTLIMNIDDDIPLTVHRRVLPAHR